MTDQDIDSDEEPGVGELKSPKKPFTKLAVELTGEDLQSPGVQKLLLAEISRLEHHAHKYDFCKDELAEAKQLCAVYAEKQKTHTFLEILYSVGLGVGAALIGLTPSIKSENYSGLVILGLGIVLMLGAVMAKLRQK